MRFVSACCEGERCYCGKPAEHKVEEVIFDDDPIQSRHPLTSYICHEHFAGVMGPAAGYDYDNAPTDPRHGGKLTADQAAARIAELEGDLSVARLQLAARACSECPAATKLVEMERENTTLRNLLARSNADCPYCGLPAEDINRCVHGFPGCGRADDMLIESD
jgi:hypothetical protein